MNRPTRAAKPFLRSTPSRPEVEPDVALADRIRVLIADDHTTVLAGLASMIGLQPDMVVVAQATNGSDAVELWRKHSPDVTMLDLRMPKLDGVGVLTEIRPLRSICSKLDVLSRTEAVAAASRRGLVQL